MSREYHIQNGGSPDMTVPVYCGEPGVQIRNTVSVRGATPASLLCPVCLMAAENCDSETGVTRMSDAVISMARDEHRRGVLFTKHRMGLR